MISNSLLPHFGKSIIIIFSCAIFNTALTQTPGVWESFGPNAVDTPDIVVLLSDPTNSATIYAGTAFGNPKGVFISNDYGVSWTQAKEPMNDKYVWTLVFIDEVLYSGASEGIFRSVDKGANWSSVSKQLENKVVLTITSAAGVIYVGTDGDGVFMSKDKGMTWTQANSPMSDKIVNTLIEVGGTLFASARSYDPDLNRHRGHGVFRSTDGGVNWSPANAPMNDQWVTSLLSVEGTLYAGAEGVFRSTDGGINWSPAKAPMTDKSVTTMLSADGTLYVGTDFHGVFRSIDGGINWSQASGPISDTIVNTLMVVHDTLYAGTYEGVFRSTDGGIDWSQANAPMNDKNVQSLISVEDRLYAGTLSNGIFRSINGGINWIESNYGLKGTASIHDLITEPGFLVAASEGLYLSKDGGFTWTRANDVTPDWVTTVVSVNGALYAGTDSWGIYYSTDSGITWTRATQPMYDKFVLNIASFNGILYAGTAFDGIFYSLDGGTNWIQSNAPMNDKWVRCLISLDGILVASTGFSQGQYHGVFRSTDGGINWIQANAPMDDKDSWVLISVDRTLYIGTAGYGVFRSVDGGSNWIQANAPMNDKDVRSLISVDGTLYAVVWQGVFRSIDGGINWFQLNDKGVSFIISIEGILYASGGKSVFRSTDEGVNWTPLNTGLSAGNIYKLAFDSGLNRLYAATTDGVYSQTLDYASPTATSVTINNLASFTKNPVVSLILVANEADSMIVSEDPTFSNTNWQAYQVNPNFVISRSDGQKTIYAKFKDLSWNESAVISAQIFLDTTRPCFASHTSPSSATVGQSISINQQVNEPNLQGMELYFHRAGEPWSENRKVAFQGTSAEIDGAFITNRGIDYRIIAKDFAGQSDTLRNGSLDFFSIPVNLGVDQAGSSPGLPAGFGGAAYRIVSMPMKLNGTPNVQSVFGDFGPYGANGDWRFWTYQGNNNWQEGDNLAIENARGYFLILRNGGTLTNKVAGTTTETTAGVLETIPGWQFRANDWTIIGNPYNARIELEQLKLANRGARLNEQVTGLQLWEYDGSSTNKGWTKEDIALKPWSGLAVFSQEADQIVFANPSDPFAPVLGKPSPQPDPLVVNLSEEWVVQIKTQTEDFSDHVNYFGVRKDASVEQDVYDWYEPPILPGGISLSFSHPEWSSYASFTSDMRPVTREGYEWPLKIKASSGSTVDLMFENLQTVPEDFEIYLLDRETGILRDLRQQPQMAIRVPQDADFKTLSIVVGKPEFVQQHSEGLNAIPSAFTLHQNYPNPFNPSTVIRYDLPVSGKVTLKIYDLLGREVKTIENEDQKEPGYFETIVDLSGFSSGVYFYRISVSGDTRFSATKKMLYLK